MFLWNVARIRSAFCMLFALGAWYLVAFVSSSYSCPDDCLGTKPVSIQPLSATGVDPQENPPPVRNLWGYTCSYNHVAKCTTKNCQNSGGSIGGWQFASWKFVSDNVPYPRCIVEKGSICTYQPQACGTFYYYALANCMGKVYSKPGYLERCF